MKCEARLGLLLRRYRQVGQRAKPAHLRMAAQGSTKALMHAKRPARPPMCIPDISGTCWANTTPTMQRPARNTLFVMQVRKSASCAARRGGASCPASSTRPHESSSEAQDDIFVEDWPRCPCTSRTVWAVSFANASTTMTQPAREEAQLETGAWAVQERNRRCPQSDTLRQEPPCQSETRPARHRAPIQRKHMKCYLFYILNG